MPETSQLKELINLFSNQFDNYTETTCLFIPIRHHSPLCAKNIQLLLNDYKPDILLIEGPSDANHLIPVLIDSRTVLPVALYTYFVDKANKYGLNGIVTPKPEIPFRYQSWHPFSEFSPEYVAIKTGFELKSEISFIDLSLEDRIKSICAYYTDSGAEKVQVVKKEPWNESDYAETIFISKLLKKTQCRDFNEFWFRQIEIAGAYNNQNYREFFQKVFALIASIRLLSSETIYSDSIMREESMLEKIIAVKSHNPEKRIAIITGAFHTINLLKKFNEKLSRPKKTLLKPNSGSNIVLTPYSYFRLSELSGYNAGIIYPWYCQHIYQYEPVSEAFYKTAIRLIVDFGKKADTRFYSVSTAEKISALELARNLSFLRDLPFPGPYEIIDAVVSSFSKSDIAESRILNDIQNTLTGSEVGQVPPNAGIFPIISNFYDELKRFRLPKLEEQKTVRLDIYRQDSHREKSRFLYQTKFLELNYAELERGPDFFENIRTDLLTESWIVHWNPQIDAQLIDLASYGSTILEACSYKIREEFAVKTAIKDKSLLLFQSAQLGLFDVFTDFLKFLIQDITIYSFSELVNVLQAFSLLYTAREILLPPEYPPLVVYIQSIYQNIINRLSFLGEVSEEQAELLSHDFRALGQLLTLKELIAIIDAEIFFNVLLQIKNTVQHPRLLGIFVGTLFLFKRITGAEIDSIFHAYVDGTYNSSHAALDFLEGLFVLSKAIIYTSSLLQILFKDINIRSDTNFVEILPRLRKLFSSFNPREIDFLGKEISKLLLLPQIIQKEQTPIYDSDIFVGKSFSELDKTIDNQLKSWSLVPTYQEANK